jgi:hypothetical protein
MAVISISRKWVIMESKLYKIIENEFILNPRESKSKPIIEGMLYEQDYIMLIAEEKAGKTILAQQITCCLSNATPFLGIFDIPEPVNVWYFATEGKAIDLQDRFIRMNNVIKMDVSKIKLIPTNFRFNTDEGFKCIREIMAMYKDNPPKVIVIDALYRAIKGSIQKDEPINELNYILSWIQAQCGCAIILVHHMTKPQRTNEGKYMERSDKDSYGSAFLLAAVDHVFWLEKWTKDPDCPKDRHLRCDTQRGGNISSDIRLRLIEPDPLYFTVVSKHIEERHRITELLKANRLGLSISSLEKKSRLTKSLCYIILKELRNEDLVIKEGELYKWIK